MIDYHWKEMQEILLSNKISFFAETWNLQKKITINYRVVYLKIVAVWNGQFMFWSLVPLFLQVSMRLNISLQTYGCHRINLMKLLWTNKVMKQLYSKSLVAFLSIQLVWVSSLENLHVGSFVNPMGLFQKRLSIRTTTFLNFTYDKLRCDKRKILRDVYYSTDDKISLLSIEKDCMK